MPSGSARVGAVVAYLQTHRTAAASAVDLPIERLIVWGADTLFDLPGDEINARFESLRTRQDRMCFIAGPP